MGKVANILNVSEDNLIFSKKEIQVIEDKIAINKRIPRKYYIECLIRGTQVIAHPEEIVRQLMLVRLLSYYHRDYIQVEYLIQMGVSKKKADIVVLGIRENEIFLIIETKQPKISKGERQLHSYCVCKAAPFGILTNGTSLQPYKFERPNSFFKVNEIPDYNTYYQPVIKAYRKLQRKEKILTKVDEVKAIFKKNIYKITSIVLLFFCIYLIMKDSSEPKKTENQSSKTDSISVITNDSLKIENIKFKADSAFKVHDYDIAIKYYKKILEEEYSDSLSKVVSKIERNNKIHYFSEGLAHVKKDNKYAYINIFGEEVTDYIYDDAAAFSQGLAWVKQNDKYGFLNKKFEIQIPFIYKGAEAGFDKGIVKVKGDNEKWGFINLKGDTITDFVYDESAYYGVGEDGLRFEKRDGKFGFIDTKGREVSKFEYYGMERPYEYKHRNEIAYSIWNETIVVKKNGKIGFLNLSGSEISDFIYDDAFENFFFEHNEDLMTVKLNNKYRLLHKNYWDVFDGEYDSIYFDWGYPIAVKENKLGLLTSYGGTHTPIIYDKIDVYNAKKHELLITQLDGKYGLITPTGYNLTDNVYDDITIFSYDKLKIIVEKDGNSYQINSHGHCIKDCPK